MFPAVRVAVEVGERVAVADGPGEFVAVGLRGAVRVKVAVGAVRLALGELLGVAERVISTVGVTLGGGVAVAVAAVVAVSDGVGDCGGEMSIANTAVVSATLTRPSSFTSELSQSLSPPNTMASTLSTSAWSTRPSQLASPRSGALDCATPAVADSVMSNAAQIPRIH